VRRWQDAYLRGDHFDQNAMLALIEEVLQSADTAGYSRTRLLAHMEWALLDKPGVDNLVEYETRLNYVLPSTMMQWCVRTICRIWRKRDNGHPAHAPGGDHRRGAAGEPVLRATGSVPPRDKGATAASQERKRGELMPRDPDLRSRNGPSRLMRDQLVCALIRRGGRRSEENRALPEDHPLR